MNHRDLSMLRDEGVRFDLLAIPVTGRGFSAYVRTANGTQEEIRAARGPRRYFKTLDGVYKYARSVDADRVTVYNSFYELEAD